MDTFNAKQNQKSEVLTKVVLASFHYKQQAVFEGLLGGWLSLHYFLDCILIF